MPEFSTRRMAWLTASSMSTSFWASSWTRSRRASADLDPALACVRLRHEVREHVLEVDARSPPCPGRRRPRAWAPPAPARRARPCARRACPPGAGPAACRGVASREASGDTSSRVPLETASPWRRGSKRSSSRSSASCFRPLAHRRRHLRLDHADAELGQVADHRLDVAADVADLGVLGGLDLQERRLRELGEPAGDLRLPDPGGADHDDVLRRDLVAQLRRARSAAASGCAARWPPRAWRAAGRRCTGPARDDLRRGELAHDVTAPRRSTWSLV